MGERHEKSIDDINLEMIVIFNCPKFERGRDWILSRRQKRIELVAAERLQAQERQLLDENLVDSVRQAQDGVSREIASSVSLAVFTQDIIARSVSEAEEAAKSRAEAEARAAATSQDGCMGSALERYTEWARSPEAPGNRRMLQGGLGAQTHVPPMTEEQKNWQADEWAMWWLQIGGYKRGPEGADQLDSKGWLPLHHACNSGHWLPQAPLVITGLVQRMYDSRLSAKTRGGRPIGHAPLHLMASHSDLAMQNAKLCRMLVLWRADPDGVDANGRTPLHHAAGTGQTDVCEALIDMLADPAREDHNGLAPIDKCVKSSGQCHRFSTSSATEPSGATICPRHGIAKQAR